MESTYNKIPEKVKKLDLNLINNNRIELMDSKGGDVCIIAKL
jgi:hypothetical protein